MKLWYLLIMIAPVTLLLVHVVSRLFVEPALRARGMEPRTSDYYRHWRLYRRECGGSAAVYGILWAGWIVAAGQLLVGGACYFFFPDLTAWD